VKGAEIAEIDLESKVRALDGFWGKLRCAWVYQLPT
jgi:hypothetical protein